MPEQWERERDEGMGHALAHSSVKDRIATKWAIVWCLQTMEWFTGDDVMKRLADEGTKLREARLLGPVIREAAGKGLIEAVKCPACETQRTRPSTRRHGAPQNLWKGTGKWTP
tara:strand:- start:1 stop:339 length:339 start_codon:yes stop_codon:yes gene_type:complete